jgi:hypothetical protein
MEIGMGLKLRHDLEEGNGRAARGCKGLALVKRGDGECRSEIKIIHFRRMIL